MMIEPDDRNAIEALRAKVQCAKGFACVNRALADLCAGKYHTELDIVECLEKPDNPCKFAHAFGGTRVCTRRLRKLVAKNFDRWSADDTAVLRGARGGKTP